MPQGQKRLTIEEALNRPATKQARPTSIEEALRRPVVAQAPGPIAAQPPQAPHAPPEVGFFENLKIGAQQGYQDYIEAPIYALAEAGESAVKGDLTPARQLAEQYGRGAVKFASAFDPAGAAYEPTAAEQDPQIAAVQAEQNRRRAGNPAFRNQNIERAKLNERAALDPSLSGRVTRGVASGVVGALPAVAAGIVSGGSVPAIAATTALQSAAQPENAALNVGMSAIPLPVGKFVAPILRRIRGGTAAAETAGARTTAALEQVPNARTTNPLPRTILERAETEALPVPAATPGVRTTAPTSTDPLTQAVEQINASNLTQEQKAALLDPLIQAVRQRTAVPPGAASNATESMVQSGWPRSTQAQPMVMPGSPNPIQQAGVLPRTFEASVAPAAPQVAAPASEQIVERMAGLQRTPSSPVSIAQLRSEFPNISKEAFDAEIQKLADADQLMLARHDAPGALSEAERNSLVKIGNDYFSAATFPDGPPAIQAAAMRAPAASPAMEVSPQYSAELEPPTFGVREAQATPYTESVGPRLEEVGYSAPSPKAQADPSLVTKEERTPVLEVISAARKAGLLSWVTTHVKNVAGSGLFQLSDEVARIPAAILDIALSPIFKRRTVTGPSVSAMARSAYQAATKGTQEAWQIIKRGVSDADVERLGLNKEINSGSKVLNTYVNGTFRMMGAEDKIFRTLALRRSLEDRARAAALTEMRQGKIPRGDVGKRTREMIAAPPEDLAAGAVADAEVATFNNSNLASDFLNAGRRAIEPYAAGKVANFGIDMTVPFPRAPTNVVARMLEATPLGYGKNVIQIAKAITKRSFTDAEQRAFAQTFGRATLGSGIVALGWKLGRDGLVTGLVEDDPTRRARDEAAGRTPGSIKIGNTWHQITGFGPHAALLVIGATLGRESEQEGGYASAAAEATVRAIAEQPLLIGTKDIARALTTPGSVPERLGSMAGSFVPTPFSAVAEAADPKQRDAQGFMAQVAKRIPGARQTLPERQDVLGRPIEDRATQFIDPTRTSTDQAQQNPLLRELVRLDQGISGFRKQEEESDDAYTAKVQSFGRIYSKFGAQLLDFRPYKAATPDLQKEALKRLNDRAKDTVRDAKERSAPATLNPAVVMAAARRALAERANKKK